MLCCRPSPHLCRSLQPDSKRYVPSADLVKLLLQSAPQLRFKLDLAEWRDESWSGRLAAQLRQSDLTPEQRTRLTLLTE